MEESRQIKLWPSDCDGGMGGWPGGDFIWPKRAPGRHHRAPCAVQQAIPLTKKPDHYRLDGETNRKKQEQEEEGALFVQCFTTEKETKATFKPDLAPFPCLLGHNVVSMLSPAGPGALPFYVISLSPLYGGPRPACLRKGKQQ